MQVGVGRWGGNWHRCYVILNEVKNLKVRIETLRRLRVTYSQL